MLKAENYSYGILQNEKSLYPLVYPYIIEFGLICKMTPLRNFKILQAHLNHLITLYYLSKFCIILFISKLAIYSRINTNVLDRVSTNVSKIEAIHWSNQTYITCFGAGNNPLLLAFKLSTVNNHTTCKQLTGILLPDSPVRLPIALKMREESHTSKLRTDYFWSGNYFMKRLSCVSDSLTLCFVWYETVNECKLVIAMCWWL